MYFFVLFAMGPNPKGWHKGRAANTYKYQFHKFVMRSWSVAPIQSPSTLLHLKCQFHGKHWFLLVRGKVPLFVHRRLMAFCIAGLLTTMFGAAGTLFGISQRAQNQGKVCGLLVMTRKREKGVIWCGDCGTRRNLSSLDSWDYTWLHIATSLWRR